MVTSEENKVRDICLIILTAIAVTVAFIYTRAVLVPLVFAIFIAMMLEPVLKWLQSTLKVRKFIAVTLTLAVMIISIMALSFFLSLSVTRFLEDAHVYRDRIIRFSGDAITRLESLGFTGGLESLKAQLNQMQLFRWVGQLGSGLLSFAGNLVLVIVFALFLILGSAQSAEGSDSILQQVQQKINRYISVKVTVSLATAALTFLVLGLLDVELAFMFAILTFLLNFIPSIGSVVAVLLPLPIILLQYGLSWQFGVALSSLGFIQFTIGNVIEPRFMGEAMNLHPVTILVFLIFWGLVWGVPGMFLAVPITATLRLFFEKIEPLQGLARLMAGELQSQAAE